MFVLLFFMSKKSNEEGFTEQQFANRVSWRARLHITRKSVTGNIYDLFCILKIHPLIQYLLYNENFSQKIWHQAPENFCNLKAKNIIFQKSKISEIIIVSFFKQNFCLEKRDFIMQHKVCKSQQKCKNGFQKLHLLHRSTIHIIWNVNINFKISGFIVISCEAEF